MFWSQSGVGVYSAEAGADSESKISDSVHLCYLYVDGSVSGLIIYKINSIFLLSLDFSADSSRCS